MVKLAQCIVGSVHNNDFFDTVQEIRPTERAESVEGFGNMQFWSMKVFTKSLLLE